MINASPLAMGLFRRDGAQPWHPANQDLKDEIKSCTKDCDAKGKREKWNPYICQ